MKLKNQQVCRKAIPLELIFEILKTTKTFPVPYLNYTAINKFKKYAKNILTTSSIIYTLNGFIFIKRKIWFQKLSLKMSEANYNRIMQIVGILEELEDCRRKEALVGQSTEVLENRISTLTNELMKLRESTLRFIQLANYFEFTPGSLIGKANKSFALSSCDKYCSSLFFFEVKITSLPDGGNGEFRLGFRGAVGVELVVAPHFAIERQNFGQIRFYPNRSNILRDTFGCAVVFQDNNDKIPTLFFTVNKKILGKGIVIKATAFTPFISKADGFEFITRFEPPFNYNISDHDQKNLELYEDSEFDN